MKRVLDEHPSSVFWGMLAGFGVLFPEIWLALLPHGIARSSLLILGSLVTMTPGLVILADAGSSIARLREEFDRRGYSGMTVHWPDYFWRSVGFALSVLGIGVLVGGLTT